MKHIALMVAGMVTPEDAETIRDSLLSHDNICVAVVEFETAEAIIHASTETETSDVIGIIEGLCGGFTARAAR